MQGYFHNKKILITGAAAGIGRGLCEALASTNTTLIAVDRDADALQELQQSCSAQVYAADVSDDIAMQQLAQTVLQQHDFVDIVIANAGVGGLNPGYAFSLEVSHHTTAINVNGLVNTIAPFLPSMVQRRRGHVVGVSSLASFRGLPNAASYSATKAAQRVMLESLRVDLRRFDVAVSCICPGFVQTAMADHDEFPMPFTLPVDRAAHLMLRAIARRTSLYLFPWQMRWLTYLNRLLPNWLFDRLIPRLSQASSDKRARVF